MPILSKTPLFKSVSKLLEGSVYATDLRESRLVRVSLSSGKKAGYATYQGKFTCTSDTVLSKILIIPLRYDAHMIWYMVINELWRGLLSQSGC